MNEQIAKFNRRKQKASELNAAKREGNQTMADETKPVANWNEQLKTNELYQLAEKAGIDVSMFKASSEDGYKTILETIQQNLKQLPESELARLSPEERESLQNLNENTPNEVDEQTPVQNNSEEIEDAASLPADEDEKDKEEATKPNETQEEQTPFNEETMERGTLEVGAAEEAPSQERDWIEEKRKFWKEYAESIENTFENAPEKDEETKTFSCALVKDDQRGEVKYVSPNAVQIDKESHLEMYQGLVKDALKNNLSITFGASLDDKQKALLLAAVLMNKEKCQDGNYLAMVNQPQIDFNAEYFKNLPADVQKVLKEYNNDLHMKQKQAEIADRLAAAKEKVHGAKDKDERYSARQEQLSALKEQVAGDPTKVVSKDKEAVEKIMAARMGIINDPSVKDASGNQITGNETYTKKKNEQNPALYAYLKDKYQSGQNK